MNIMIVTNGVSLKRNPPILLWLNIVVFRRGNGRKSQLVFDPETGHSHTVKESRNPTRQQARRHPAMVCSKTDGARATDAQHPVLLSTMTRPEGKDHLSAVSDE